LNVRAKRQEERETRKRDFLRREIRYGRSEYSTDLPKGLKAEDLKASYKDGVLELTAAMPKELLPKQVKVQIESAEPKRSRQKRRAPPKLPSWR